MNIANIKYKRSNLILFTLFSCILSGVYFGLYSDACRDEPNVKCIIFCLAAGLISFCKIAIYVHLAFLLANILCKKIPSYFSMPSYKEMQFVGILFLASMGLFFLLNIYYEESFYTEGLYLAGKYLIVAISIMLHNKFKKRG
jgi:hypothetical protein